MKIFYPLLVSTLLITSGFQLQAQCRVTLKASDDGKGGYTFQAMVSDTDSVFTSYWTIDSLLVDSNSMADTFKFYTNGNHRVCFQYSDTTGCTIDTCTNINVEDAVYYPMLDSVNIWSLTYSYCAALHGPDPARSNCMGLTYNSISTESDTLINNILYKSLVGYDYNSLDTCFEGFTREDTENRKIYYLDATGDSEVLLYNFSMKIHDSIYINFFNSNNANIQSGIYILDSINQITITIGKRRAFFLRPLNTHPSQPFVWLEGVGSLAHPIYSYSNMGLGCPQFGCGILPYSDIVPYSNLSHVTCFSHSQQIYFDACGYENALNNDCIRVYDSCMYSDACGGAVQNLSLLSAFNLSPNPSTGLVTINLGVASSSEFELSVLDINGKQVMATYPLGKLSTGTYNKQIDLSALSAGFYTVECKTSEGSLYRKLVIAK